ncbi:hypothetical protein ACFLU6_14350 [Acidobacteriota bacterium]
MTIRQNIKRLLIWCGLFFFVSLALHGFELYLHLYDYTKGGTLEIPWIDTLGFSLFGMLLLAGGLFIYFIFLAITGQWDERALFVSSAIIVYLIVGVVCMIFSVQAKQKYRMHAFLDLAERSEVLVDAIRTYETDNGHPPEKLADLVPGYLPSVPGTGMKAYPDYVYVVGERAQSFGGQPWVLYVETPSGPLNWDLFIYFPSKEYPKDAYGGHLEPVKDWAYVHE